MPRDVRRLRVLVVGSGIAGLTAALAAAADGHDVTVATKSTLDDTATARAQGGVSAVLASGPNRPSASSRRDEPDSVASHVRDTLAAGAGLGDRHAVEVLCESADESIRDLLALGTRFDRDADAERGSPSGRLARGLEAAHSHPRILHAFGDGTGREIQRALSSAVRQAAERGELRLLDRTFLVEIALSPAPTKSASARDATPGVSAAPRVVGAWLQRADGPGGSDRSAPHLVSADAVVLATGGAGRLFAHTSNPEVSTGDGIAAAARAGAEVADLEFVQFHPTVLAESGGALISEAVRGEGAVLLNEAGERFLLGVHPDAELAPRDVVARGIADEMVKQGGRPVRLDARHHGREFLERRFPSITARIDASGLDWSLETVPVTPAAHYLMGGVVTDLSGRTSIPGLYAAGETARTGVHGANRLASNSLLEGAVFGRRVAKALLELTRDAAAESFPLADQLQCEFAPEKPVQPFSRQNRPQVGQPLSHDEAPTFSREALQRLMWTHAGLHRSGPALEDARRTLDAWASARAEAVRAETWAGMPETRAARAEPAERRATVAEREDSNLLLLAQLTVAAALDRRESVGAHFRTDETAVPGPQLQPQSQPALRRPLRQKAMAR